MSSLTGFGAISRTVNYLTTVSRQMADLLFRMTTLLGSLNTIVRTAREAPDEATFLTNVYQAIKTDLEVDLQPDYTV